MPIMGIQATIVATLKSSRANVSSKSRVTLTSKVLAPATCGIGCWWQIKSQRRQQSLDMPQSPTREGNLGKEHALTSSGMARALGRDVQLHGPYPSFRFLSVFNPASLESSAEYV